MNKERHCSTITVARPGRTTCMYKSGTSYRDYMYKPPKSYVQSSEIIRTNYNPPRSCVQVVNMIHTSCRDHICTSLVQATEMYKSPRSYVCGGRREQIAEMHKRSRRDYTCIASRWDHICTSVLAEIMYIVQSAEIICTHLAEIICTIRRDQIAEIYALHVWCCLYIS